jgi:hypothetical protein
MSAQNSERPRMEKRVEIMKALNLEPINSDEECNTKLQDGLKAYFASHPHATLEEATTTSNSAVASYLLGRWGVAQARLGKGSRLKTAMAFQLKDKIFSHRDDQRRPANEYGKDAEITGATGGDPLLAYWITLGNDSVGDNINDIENNLDQNRSFTYDETSYDKLKNVMMLSAGYERALVGQVSDSVLEGVAQSDKVDGEDVVKTLGGTYSIVFFKPVEFTAAECTKYVNSGEWHFTDNGIEPTQRCKQMVDVKANYTLFPVAVDPAFAKTLKANSSNLNCLLNQKWIFVKAPEGTKIASYTGQLVAAKKGGDGLMAIAKVPAQYNQMNETFMSSCVPISVYDGVGAKKKLVNFIGIPLE